MGKIAFVFSGQGDQFPGMGQDLYEKYPSARRVFDLCDNLRPGTSSQCFTGGQEELQETKNTQPCLFAMELAVANVLLEKGITPDCVAGFSLGEVTAATVGGVFSWETGFQLVCKRGELMQREAEKWDTFMAAVVKLSTTQVQTICDRYAGVYPVNFNCPGQIAVSGLAAQAGDFLADVKAAGGRAILLKVKGAFHSPFMNGAAKAFAQVLKKVELKKGDVTLYSNLTAAPYTKEAADLLSEQICNAVQWEKLICNMITDGVDTFLEIGPGRTLTNMIRRIDGSVKAMPAVDYIAGVEKC